MPDMSIFAWLRRAFGRSASEPAASCLACDSTELEILADEVYRCSICGYEGGEGLSAWLAARKRSEIAGMSPDQRVALARDNLRSARNVLVGAVPVGSLALHEADTVLAPKVHLVLGVELFHGAEQIGEEQRISATLFQELLQSEQLLEQAAIALSEQFQIAPSLRLTSTQLQHDELEVQGMLTEIADVQRTELERLERVASARHHSSA